MPQQSQMLNCTMKFECPKVWADLDSTQDPHVRQCPQCQRQVTFCHTQAQLDELAAKGECVAFQANPVRQMMGSVALKGNGPVVRTEAMRKFIDSL